MPPSLQTDLEEVIGYAFQNSDWLRQALTHRSYTEEFPAAGSELANEQMEFLGDSILGFVVSEALVERFPNYREGRLSKLKAHLVSAAHLHPIAERMGIGRFLLLGRGEEQSGGRVKKALLVNTLEALVAAIYRDGGMAPARAFVRRWILDPVDWGQPPTVDFKSELQELLQERRAAPPRYRVVRESGPEHQKLFTIQLRINGEVFAQAEGNTKKAAEQAAARIALSRIQETEVERRN